jgi:sensor c-di-GMP phosphodiesterase-like protein
MFTALLVILHIILGLKFAHLFDEIIKKIQAKQYAQHIEAHKIKARTQIAIENASIDSFQYEMFVCGKNKTCSYTSIVITDNKKKEVTMSSQFCYFCGNYINTTNSGLYKKSVLCRCK